ncbi:MAG TPA: SDR family oxidoreductase [Haliangiales bacterium]|nr:SDR family oxidoreductase [Haliangiales bacterium]
MARFLVTGGAGFIGSNLTKALVERGDDVVVLDNFSTGRRQNLAGLEARVVLHEADVRDARAVERAVDGCDFVLHQAALPSVPRSVEAPLESNAANVDGTLAVLEAARKARVRRVVFAASSSAYGETPTLPKVETMPTQPLSPYAASKLAGEHYMRAYHASYGLETVSLRYFNVFGPNQNPESQYAAVIPRFVTAALAGRPPTIYGDGLQSRDFCHIDNAIEANLLATVAPGAAGEVFNIACGERITLLEVIARLAAIVGRPIEPIHEPARAGDIRHSLADIGRARAVLGYRAAVGFDDGLRRTVEWYRCAA